MKIFKIYNDTLKKYEYFAKEDSVRAIGNHVLPISENVSISQSDLPYFLSWDENKNSPVFDTVRQLADAKTTRIKYITDSFNAAEIADIPYLQTTFPVSIELFLKMKTIVDANAFLPGYPEWLDNSGSQPITTIADLKGLMLSIENRSAYNQANKISKINSINAATTVQGVNGVNW